MSQILRSCFHVALMFVQACIAAGLIIIGAAEDVFLGMSNALDYGDQAL